LHSFVRACVLVVPLLGVASYARAQDMNLALSRLGAPNDTWDPATQDTNGNGMFDAGEPFNDGNGNARFDPCNAIRGGPPDFCQDDDAYTRVMTQFAASLMPPILTPAGTRGVRGIYVGFETWITGIDTDDSTATGDAWHRAVEGDGMSADTRHSRFVDTVLVWGRLNVRKGLPFGFELGTSLGYLFNTSYFALGAEIRWALFEGFREGVGWIPDVAVRAAVETMVGDGEFNVTIPSFDAILSEPFVVASSVEVIPWVDYQLAFPFVDSELVDLDPEETAFTGCDPDPATPTPTTPGSPPYCRMNGTELNDNVVFPSLRSMRMRLGAGLQIRFEWFTILGSFQFDLLPPGDPTLDDNYNGANLIPDDMPRQWQTDIGVGLTL
jgi:hypothetical protein